MTIADILKQHEQLETIKFLGKQGQTVHRSEVIEQ